MGFRKKLNLQAKVESQCRTNGRLSHDQECESCPLNEIPLYHTIVMTIPFKLNKSKRMKDGKANLVYSQEFRLNFFQ